MQTGHFRGFEVAIHDPGIAVVTFNQPERLNGMTHHMKRDLVETLLQAQMDDAVRVIVFTAYVSSASMLANGSRQTPGVI